MKKTLLMAAAALAAGIISSQAQPVYSQNVVGYVNVVYTNGRNAMAENPLNAGLTNGGSEVFGTQLPNGTQIFQWNGVNNFNVVTYDAQLAIDLGVTSPWFNGDSTAVAAAPRLAPGSAYFLLPTATFTNTYVGTVAVAVGSSVTNSLANGINSMVGSIIPYGGSLTNTVIGYVPPNGTQIFQWNGVNGFNVSTYDAQLAIDLGVTSPWFNGDSTAVAPAPTIKVAEGYFVLPTGAFKWVQSF
jgi:hypothetical protein